MPGEAGDHPHRRATGQPGGDGRLALDGSLAVALDRALAMAALRRREAERSRLVAERRRVAAARARLLAGR